MSRLNTVVGVDRRLLVVSRSISKLGDTRFPGLPQINLGQRLSPWSAGLGNGSAAISPRFSLAK